jgi:hypothetical protein
METRLKPVLSSKTAPKSQLVSAVSVMKVQKFAIALPSNVYRLIWDVT